METIGIPTGTVERAQRVLAALLGTAVAVSIVHYVDNVAAFERFPQSDGVIAVTRPMIVVAWFAFTAYGVAGYLLFRRGRHGLAAACLAAYSLSGLIGIGHYLAPGMTEAVWWRQAHVLADILCGVAVVAFAIWTARLTPARG